MKKQYDFSGGKRGSVVRVAPGKTRITIRIDDDVLEWFRGQVHKAGGGSYQSLINDSLRAFIASKDSGLEDIVRRVIREELPRYTATRAVVSKRRPRSRPPSAPDR
ncbi:MAG: BrnA antitoxin family protein [Planctomycetes bacterium]|nr:BrnA antitoxin family protein [Planctomycetota bacterium]